ncbi:DgyrCDS5136 [Dimorphilus gyrociliatus]|uniref:DgyrCDS5136 n=1 Tax=Dimorphilus gyrociliatus TaxID=2664684 RepID=A0A7I8VIX0_9ANNE|nr:DgyrCDS5136 [Dimorphilus gyrociliatus]
MASNQTKIGNIGEKMTPKERQAHRTNNTIQNDLNRRLKYLDIERRIILNAKNTDINLQKRKLPLQTSKSPVDSSADLLIAHRRSSLEIEIPKLQQSNSLPHNLCSLGHSIKDEWKNKSDESLEQVKSVCPYGISGGIRMGNGCKRRDLQDWLGLRDRKLKRTPVRVR